MGLQAKVLERGLSIKQHKPNINSKSEEQDFPLEGRKRTYLRSINHLSV